MKNILIIALLLLPLFSTAQSKYKQRREEMKREYEQAKQQRTLNKTFAPGLDEAGYHLQRAASDYTTSILLTATGGVFGAAAMVGEGGQTAGIIIIGIGALSGVMFHLFGNNELRKAGAAMRKQAKLSFSGNKLSLSF